MANNPAEAKRMSRIRLANYRKQIQQATDNWHEQALSAVEAWDGQGSDPVTYGPWIIRTIEDYEKKIAEAM